MCEPKRLATGSCQEPVTLPAMAEFAALHQLAVGRTGNPADAGLCLTAIIFISLVSPSAAGAWACGKIGKR
ncbi:hypothetical protein CYD53_107178 [Bosea psychrotolerans]|uniref:Uncharacterized protein n=2 Tax=Bosea psychrotolerans TaxID=1871628 RepID=A0A2S4M9U1_9HYPH|nr:hypothetical protein CYD53_107178 [Bosea psychrotolerans]